jgi:hypothetical protein
LSSKVYARHSPFSSQQEQATRYSPRRTHDSQSSIPRTLTSPIANSKEGSFISSAKKLLFYFVLALGLSGCSTSGGTIGGLVPAPKITKGKLSESIYTAQDNMFSVGSPFEEGSNAYTYMSITEDYRDEEDHIVFSSSAAPAEVYRVDIIKDIKTGTDLGNFILTKYKEVFESTYKTPMDPQRDETVLIGGISSSSTTFTQQVPERKSGMQVAKGFTAIYTYYYFEKDGNAFAILINRMAPGDETFTKGAEERVSKFIGSFQAN